MKRKQHVFTSDEPGPFFTRVSCSCGEKWLVADKEYIGLVQKAHMIRLSLNGHVA